jgi:hypothetical protein
MSTANSSIEMTEIREIVIQSRKPPNNQTKAKRILCSIMSDPQKKPTDY